MAQLKATLNPLGQLLLDKQLRSDERMIRDAVRVHAQDKLAPRW